MNIEPCLTVRLDLNCEVQLAADKTSVQRLFHHVTPPPSAPPRASDIWQVQRYTYFLNLSSFSFFCYKKKCWKNTFVYYQQKGSASFTANGMKDLQAMEKKTIFATFIQWTMSDILDIFIDTLGDGICITGMVIILMMIIEFINRGTQGRAFNKLGKSRTGQILLGAGMGIIPGCFGGFAIVSMYSHGVISFGALVAMMIASSGDEAFFMLAMIPRQALVLTAIVFVIAIITGVATDRVFKTKIAGSSACGGSFELHEEDMHQHTHKHNNEGHNVARIATIAIMLLLTAFFAYTFITNTGGHSGHESHGEGLNLSFIEERWLKFMFAIAGAAIAIVTFFLPSHVVEEHLWNHVICKHMLSVFLWTVGTIFVIQIGLHYFDIDEWTSENTIWMIVLAALIGLIPESGPHLIFVTLFASGSVPFSVFLTSCISQDGHAGLPLLADDKRGFLRAKLINASIAFVAGMVCHVIGF